MTTTFFHGGTVWTGAGAGDERALLVRDGVVVAVGAAAEAAASAAGEVERIDLEGGFLMPSFGDGHAHPMFGGLEADGPDVRSCRSVEEIVAEVRRYAEAHPELEWITGASYDGSLAEQGLFDARWLDDAVADRPVLLRAWDYHTVWVNSRALELAGIDAATPEPELGEIPRREDGTPLGTLREWGAVDLVTAVMPPRSVEAGVRALERAGRYYLERGVTWVQDAWVEPADLDVYLAAAASGALPLRFNLALYADPRRFLRDLPGMAMARDRVAAAGSPLLTANTIKFFADGVVENETGALLEPYCSGLHSHGMSVWGAERLAEAVRAADAAGFQVHVHAIGDAAVRQALDAIERAIDANGPRDRRPVIAHAQLIDDADLARFAELGVIANMQPLWAQLDALMTVLTVPRLGRERSDRQYRMRSLAGTGATLAFGSDWPVSSGDPRDGLAIAASRRTVDGEPAGGWTPHEIVPIEAALGAYTSAVAHQAFADHAAAPWGRIVPGASADLVRLARDPRTVDPHDLPAVAVRETYLAGAPRLTPADAAPTASAPDPHAEPERSVALHP
ncbi:N-substituted formamide deformylase [Agromyces sp. NDB4Y10]|uniref:amidohydrolase n=1 Tax=Agromyces sp. NDB4Y10 TaxID=1775951 RepID=UPI0007B1CDA9|nr:amidohydrolase [Agromyces sp. NDB4Y10]KZE94384.1 N-substituted formamide deformylase [Agromyces sp. NDB4Y10]